MTRLTDLSLNHFAFAMEIIDLNENRFWGVTARRELKKKQAKSNANKHKKAL